MPPVLGISVQRRMPALKQHRESPRDQALHMRAEASCGRIRSKTQRITTPAVVAPALAICSTGTSPPRPWVADSTPVATRAGSDYVV